MNLAYRLNRVVPPAVAASLLCAAIMAVDLTLSDANWRERGGYKGMGQATVLFFAYGFPLWLAMTGFFLAAGGAQLRSRAAASLAAALAGGIVYWLILGLWAGEPIRTPLDLAAGLLPGALMGFLTHAAARPDRKQEHG